MTELTLMSNGRSVSVERKSRFVVVSTDAEFVQTARSAFNSNAIGGFSILECGLNSGSVEREICAAAVAIVDLGAPEQNEQHIPELQHLLSRIGRDLPVIVVVDALSEVVARILVQMRVADILVKPVASLDLLAACTRVTRTKVAESQIYAFLPVTGGVGATTLAIQSALTLLGGKARENLSTCLLDLNFHSGACADYLDIEARLNLKEIELNPVRLDRQLLEGMLSHHPSGLAVITTPGFPTELASVEPSIVMALLNVVCQCFDQIVIDMPRAWHVWTDNIVLGSNKLFLVSEATVPGVRKAKQLVQSISTRLGQRPHPKVIVNRFQRRFFNTGLRRADLANTLGDAFACTVPYNYKLVREAIDRGLPLDEIQKNSDVAAAIRRLIVPRGKAKSSSLLQSLGRSPPLNWAWRGHA
jgi:pilus assembly protein CpaE